MREEVISLTQKEHERLSVIRKVREKGVMGLAHENRGKPSPKRIAEALVGRIVELLKEGYRDFKPKFAAEKLAGKERIKVRDEKLRQIMIEAGLWRVRRRKTEVHQWRERKAYCRRWSRWTVRITRGWTTGGRRWC